MAYGERRDIELKRKRKRDDGMANCGINEPCADKTDDSRCELAHNRMAAGLDAYGERRDIELKRKRKRDRGMAINRTKESRIMKKTYKDHGYEDLFLPSEIKQDRNRKNESE